MRESFVRWISKEEKGVSKIETMRHFYIGKVVYLCCLLAVIIESFASSSLSFVLFRFVLISFSFLGCYANSQKQTENASSTASILFYFIFHNYYFVLFFAPPSFTVTYFSLLKWRICASLHNFFCFLLVLFRFVGCFFFDYFRGASLYFLFSFIIIICFVVATLHTGQTENYLEEAKKKRTKKKKVYRNSPLFFLSFLSPKKRLNHYHKTYTYYPLLLPTPNPFFLVFPVVESRRIRISAADNVLEGGSATTIPPSRSRAESNHHWIQLTEAFRRNESNSFLSRRKKKKVYPTSGVGLYAASCSIFGWSPSRRFVVAFTACVIVAVLIVASTLTTYALLRSAHLTAVNDLQSEELTLANNLSESIANVIDMANYAIADLHGLTLGSIGEGAPPQPEEGRIKNFEFVAKKMFNRFYPGGTLFLAYEGIITQIWPVFSRYSGIDLLAENLLGPDRFPSTYHPEVKQRVGRFTQSFSVHGFGWSLIRASAVYDGVEEGVSKLWGFSGAIIELTGLPSFEKIANVSASRGMEYAILIEDESGMLHVIDSSFGWDESIPQSQIHKFVDDGQSSIIEQQMVTMKLVVRSVTDAWSISRGKLALFMCLEIFIPLLLLLFFITVYLYLTRAYQPFQHAPKCPPFAMLKIGPHHAEELWSLAPEQMSETGEQLATILHQHMAKCKAYPVPQLQPYTSTYILESIDQAVNMSFGVMEDVVNRAIDEPLVSLLGEDGRFMISCAIHWCTEAEVTVNEEQEAVQYRGTEVIYGNKLWVFCPSNTVIISKAAKEEFVSGRSRLAGFQVQYHDSVFMKGFTDTQDLFAVYHTDLNRRRRRHGTDDSTGYSRLREEDDINSLDDEHKAAEPLMSSFPSSDFPTQSLGDAINSSHDFANESARSSTASEISALQNNGTNANSAPYRHHYQHQKPSTHTPPHTMVTSASTISSVARPVVTTVISGNDLNNMVSPGEAAHYTTNGGSLTLRPVVPEVNFLEACHDSNGEEMDQGMNPETVNVERALLRRQSTGTPATSTVPTLGAFEEVPRDASASGPVAADHVGRPAETRSGREERVPLRIQVSSGTRSSSASGHLAILLDEGGSPLLSDIHPSPPFGSVVNGGNSSSVTPDQLLATDAVNRMTGVFVDAAKASATSQVNVTSVLANSTVLQQPPPLPLPPTPQRQQQGFLNTSTSQNHLSLSSQGPTLSSSKPSSPLQPTLLSAPAQPEKPSSSAPHPPGHSAEVSNQPPALSASISELSPPSSQALPVLHPKDDSAFTAPLQRDVTVAGAATGATGAGFHPGESSASSSRFLNPLQPTSTTSSSVARLPPLPVIPLCTTPTASIATADDHDPVVNFENPLECPGISINSRPDLARTGNPFAVELSVLSLPEGASTTPQDTPCSSPPHQQQLAATAGKLPLKAGSSIEVDATAEPPPAVASSPVMQQQQLVSPVGSPEQASSPISLSGTSAASSWAGGLGWGWGVPPLLPVGATPQSAYLKMANPPSTARGIGSRGGLAPGTALTGRLAAPPGGGMALCSSRKGGRVGGGMAGLVSTTPTTPSPVSRRRHRGGPSAPPYSHSANNSTLPPPPSPSRDAPQPSALTALLGVDLEMSNTGPLNDAGCSQTTPTASGYPVPPMFMPRGNQLLLSSGFTSSTSSFTDGVQPFHLRETPLINSVVSSGGSTPIHHATSRMAGTGGPTSGAGPQQHRHPLGPLMPSFSSSSRVTPAPLDPPSSSLFDARAQAGSSRTPYGAPAVSDVFGASKLTNPSSNSTPTVGTSATGTRANHSSSPGGSNSRNPLSLVTALASTSLTYQDSSSRANSMWQMSAGTLRSHHLHRRHSNSPHHARGHRSPSIGAAGSGGGAPPGDRTYGGIVIHNGNGSGGNYGNATSAVGEPMRISALPLWVSRRLEDVFEAHPLAAGIDYNHLRLPIAVFFTCQYLLFQPLTQQERTNVSRCLATAFGVPLDGLNERDVFLCCGASVMFNPIHVDDGDGFKKGKLVLFVYNIGFFVVVVVV
eukprot:gene6362-4587_t